MHYTASYIRKCNILEGPVGVNSKVHVGFSMVYKHQTVCLVMVRFVIITMIILLLAHYDENLRGGGRRESFLL